VIDAWGWGEGGSFFDDDYASLSFGILCSGECVSDLLSEEFEAFFFWALEPISGGADYAVDCAAVAIWFAEEPLHGAGHEGGVGGGEDRAVEPEVCAEDWDTL
jgi:hypothetical protein